MNERIAQTEARRPEDFPAEAPACACGIAEPAVGNYFVSTYPPFSSWSEQEVGEFEAALDGGLPASGGPGLGLYVHIPFCERRCDYCYYLSYDDRHRATDRYLAALGRELALLVERSALAGRPVDFVYFGGGTPSLLSAARIERLFARLGELASWEGAREITFECAPRSVSEGKLSALREARVTRISLGIQELDDRVLRLNRRVHLVADVERAWAAIARVGFEVRNVDLIAGLPGQTDASFGASLERVIAMEPESVTIYQLEIPFNTPLYRALRDEPASEQPAGWEAKRDRLRRGFARLEAGGYHVRSGYTAVRDPERHRFVYQDEQYRGADLLGIGASSFSYLGGVHHQNLADLDRYLARVDEGRLPLWRAHRLDGEERLVRELVLQLKLGEADAAALRRKFGIEVVARFGAPLGELAAAGWLALDGDRIRVTREGLVRIDRLLPRLYLPRHRGIRYS